MPNYCTNELLVWSDDPAQLLDFVKKSTNENGRFTLAGTYPCPPILSEVSAGSDENCWEIVYGPWKRLADYTWLRKGGVENGEKAESREELIEIFVAAEATRGKRTLEDIMAIAKKYQDNIDNHGHKTWYSWCIENWGTKWDAIGDCEWDDVPDENGEGNAEVRFDTAWSPPVAWLEHVAEMYPALHFTLHYREDGCCFKGVAVADGGEIVTDESVSW